MRHHTTLRTFSNHEPTFLSDARDSALTKDVIPVVPLMSILIHTIARVHFNAGSIREAEQF